MFDSYVQCLTFVSDFCQKLQRSQDKAVRREKGEAVSSDEDLAPRKKKGEDDIDFLKHPFALKPTAPITINIPVSYFQLYSSQLQCYTFQLQQ